MQIAIRPELAKFIHEEWSSILPETKLREQNRPSAFDPDSKCYDQKERSETGCRSTGKQNIKGAPQAHLRNRS